MAELPKFCASIKGDKPCPAPTPMLIGESEEHWILKCKSCRRVQVMVKDNIKAKADYEKMIARVRPKHEWERPRNIFDFGRKR